MWFGANLGTSQSRSFRLRLTLIEKFKFLQETRTKNEESGIKRLAKVWWSFLVSNPKFLGSFTGKNCLRISALENEGRNVNNKINTAVRDYSRNFFKTFGPSNTSNCSNNEPKTIARPNIYYRSTYQYPDYWRPGGGIGNENLYRAAKLLEKRSSLASTIAPNSKRKCFW